MKELQIVWRDRNKPIDRMIITYTIYARVELTNNKKNMILRWQINI